jgi:hypothetical protein
MSLAREILSLYENEIKWKHVSRPGRGKQAYTHDDLYNISYGFIGLHKGKHKAKGSSSRDMGWNIGKRNSKGDYESDDTVSFSTMAQAKEHVAKRAKAFGYEHVSHTVEDRERGT